MTGQSPSIHHAGEGSSSSFSQNHHEPRSYKGHDEVDTRESNVETAIFDEDLSTKNSDIQLAISPSELYSPGSQDKDLLQKKKETSVQLMVVENPFN